MVLAHAASVQGDQMCHKKMGIPLNILAYVTSLMLILNVSLGGIHVKGHTEAVASLLPLIFVIVKSFLSYFACMLVIFTWLYDYLAICLAIGQQEQITAEESEVALGLFRRLKSANKHINLAIFSHVQMLIIFSRYNTLQGEKKLIKENDFMEIYLVTKKQHFPSPLMPTLYEKELIITNNHNISNI